MTRLAAGPPYTSQTIPSQAHPSQAHPSQAHPSDPRTGGRASWLLVMPMRVAERHVLLVAGEADLHTAAQLRDELLAAVASRPSVLVVELGALDFCDLHGLDALHDAVRLAEVAGTTLTLQGMRPQLAWLCATFPPGSARPWRTGSAGCGEPAGRGGPAPTRAGQSPGATTDSGPTEPAG